MISARSLLTLVVMKLVLIGIPAGALGPQSIDTDSLIAKLKPEIEQTMKEGSIPSVTIALVSGDRIIWTEGFGYSNVWARIPAVPENVYLIGSTFKTLVTVAMLQLMEAGKFKLDDPVKNHLIELTVQKEDSSNPVTFRHLFTHTSGLPSDLGITPVWEDRATLPLKDYLKRALKLKFPTMSKFIYSNVAYTLMGYLIEKFSGVSFKKYMKKNIFIPLEMQDTTVAPRPDMLERLAIPYAPGIPKGTFKPAMWFRGNVWPAGLVYGTVTDQAKWLIANLNRGVYKNHQLISPETFEEMMRVQYDQFKKPILGWLNDTTGCGLTWWISERQGDTLFAHSGYLNGYTAHLVGNLDQKTGFAILTNADIHVHRHIFELGIKALDLIEAHSSN